MRAERMSTGPSAARPRGYLPFTGTISPLSV
jgi:hypothetical protein